MINEKRLVDNMGLFGKSTESKKMATNFKRLSGGLQNIRSFDLELSAAEQKSIADAISILSDAAAVYRKATHILQKKEKAKRENYSKATELVKASSFGKLTFAQDKLLLVAAMSPYMLEDIEVKAFSARYATTRTFESVLEEISYGVAQVPEQMQERLDAAWQKFQEQCPVLLQRYGERFRIAISLIEGEAP